MRPSVMIFGGNIPTTLGLVRALGRRGVPVMVGGDHRLSAAAFSRYTARWFLHPRRDAGLEAMHAAIIERVRAWRPAVLFPVFVQAWEVVYAHYEEYTRLTAVIPSPGPDLFGQLQDKATLADLARQHEMLIPATFVPTSREEALGMADRLPYPVVLKLRRATAGRGMRFVADARRLPAALVQMPEVPVIQEYLAGDEYDVSLLCDHGEPLAASVYVTLRKYPLPYGVPVACRTVRDDGLAATCGEFLRRLRYHGVANLDLLRDVRDGQIKLVDFNPRLGGTTEISVRSGVDLPWMLYRLALGEAVEPCLAYDIGLEFRWLLFDEFRHLAQTAHRWETLRALSRWHRVATNVSWTDPFPHVAEGLALLWGLRKRWRPAKRSPP